MTKVQNQEISLPFTYGSRGQRIRYKSEGRRVSNTNDDAELWVITLPKGKFSIIATSLKTILSIWPPDSPINNAMR